MIRRYYIDASDIEDVEGATEEQVALAEQLIDAYVGFQDRFMKLERLGKITSVSGKKLTDNSANTALRVYDNYYAGMILEMLSGDAIGEARRITASGKDLTITYEGEELNVGVGDVFKIYQLGKFPRRRDVYTKDGEEVYYKSIPQAVKEATIAQVQFVMEMGDDFFTGESAEYDSERIGKYSYSRGSQGQSAIIKMLSPKARNLLRGIKNSTGRLVRDNPTRL